eukprot:COSAG04_NODE_31648_length_255_cov_1.307692_1_plen_41_part_00
MQYWTEQVQSRLDALLAALVGELADKIAVSDGRGMRNREV